MIELLDALKIKNNYNYEKKILNGYIQHPDSSFELDLNIKEAKKSQIIINFKESDFLISQTNIYFLPDIFDKLFNFMPDVNFSKLQIKLNSNYELPVYVEEKRKKNFFFIDNINNKFEFKPLIYGRTYHWLNGFLMSYNINFGYQNQGLLINGNSRFNCQLLGADFESVNYFYQNTTANYNSFRIEPKLRYFISDNDILSQISIGFNNNFSYRINYLPNYYFSGITLTNELTQIPYHYDNFEIKDRIDPGWQVELYQNGILKKQTITDPLGFYSFDLPFNYGSTNIELRFFGPNAEQYSKLEIIKIPLEFLRPGEFKYILSLGNYRGETDLFGNFRLSFGINKWLTNTFDYSFENKNKKNYFRNELSLKVSNEIFISASYYFDELSKIIVNWFTSDKGSYRLIFTQNFKENKFLNPDVINMTDLHFSLPRIINNVSISIFNQLVNTKNIISSRLNTFISYYFSPFHFNLNYLFEYNKNNKLNIVDYTQFLSVTGGINFSSNNYDSFWGSSNFSLNSDIDIKNKNISRIGFIYSQQIFKDINIVLNCIYNNNYFVSKINRFQFNVMILLNANIIRSRSSITYVDENNKYLNQSFEGMLGFNSNLYNFFLVNSNYVSSYGNASAMIRSFIDVNNNNKFDDGEYIIPDLKFNVSSTSDFSSKSGLKYLHGLIPYARYNVILEEKSIKNINLTPKYLEFSFISEPGIIKPIDIPVLVTGIIEGNVLRDKGGRKEGQAGVKIHIMSEDSSYHETQPVFSDGSFYKMGLMPGNFIAWVDSLQCAILDVHQEDTVKRFTVKSTKTGDFIEGLDFVLIDNKERSKPKIRIDTISTPIVPQEEILIDTLVNGNDKHPDINNDGKLKGSKSTGNGSIPQVHLFYKESKWTWLSIPMQKELDKIAIYLIENPNAKAQIDGHSDNFGTLDENMKISEQRAKEVVGYLYRKGIPLNRLYSSGHGALYPLGDNKSSQGRAKNRRVEIKIID